MVAARHQEEGLGEVDDEVRRVSLCYSCGMTGRRQPESEEDGEIGGVQIVGNVEKIKEEEGAASATHTHREVEESIQEPGKRRSTW